MDCKKNEYKTVYYFKYKWIMNKMETKKQLIDDICKDNDYLLTFQTTKEAQKFAVALITLRDNKIDDINDANNINDINNVKNAIDTLITLLNNQISDLYIKEHCEEYYEDHVDYLQEILDSLLKSKNRFA